MRTKTAHFTHSFLNNDLGQDQQNNKNTLLHSTDYTVHSTHDAKI